MIFGAAVFAEPTFADMGRMTSVDDGWIDVWRDPCEQETWAKRPSECVEFTKVEKKPSKWTVIK